MGSLHRMIPAGGLHKMLQKMSRVELEEFVKSEKLDIWFPTPEEDPERTEDEILEDAREDIWLHCHPEDEMHPDSEALLEEVMSDLSSEEDGE